MKTFEQLIRGDKVFYLDTDSGIVEIHTVKSNEYNTLELDYMCLGLLFQDFPIGEIKRYSKFKVYREENDIYSGIYYSDKKECMEDLQHLIEYQIANNKCSINKLINENNEGSGVKLNIRDVKVIL